MFEPALVQDARQLIDDFAAAGLKIATAESCTGGLIAALLTEVPGSSRVVERGFVTYSNIAKAELLGIDMQMIEAFGAVSKEVAAAMAEGAVSKSRADISVAVTGITGPGGGTTTKPVGLVFLATARRGEQTQVRECRFGPIGRTEIRLGIVREALTMLRQSAFPTP